MFLRLGRWRVKCLTTDILCFQATFEKERYKSCRPNFSTNNQLFFINRLFIKTFKSINIAQKRIVKCAFIVDYRI